MSMSCRSTALIITSSPTSLAAAAEVAVPCSEMLFLLPAGASASGPSPAPPTAVVTLPPPPANTVVYDPVWSFGEEPGESLVLGTVALRSPIHSSPPTARPSPAQNAAELSLQDPAVPSSSPCEKALMQPLTGTATCLHCVKQLKKKGILCICFFSHSHCFCCTCNNDSCLSMPKQYRVRISELQVLTDSVKTEKIFLIHLQKKVKA
ncbi:uncharacterized protein BDCG_17766 [Blastomyces dermatitidis ER-3]|uniref:Uncharacterized protein n=1 Tax=Ajellomyces dermatitidis (strain ER-3 / ATCC MYA-2586) TaxID=559297 RepID=A0ABX2W070_AJEDR|nr:uncharacterized protein BDCG_17766 [Blastomyces dermatitidis ER-3]OAT02784.1 hypothetical protein BDCG_17766 [Blastomyces dermatitidis ER-3]